MARYEILGMPVDRIPAAEFVDYFVGKAKAGGAGYVCVPNFPQCILAYDDATYAAILRGADKIMPDSTVLQRFVALKYGLQPLPTLRGDQLTLAICRKAAATGVSIALVGGKNDQVLARMALALLKECPDLKIAYAYSPPFDELTPPQESKMLADLRNNDAKILFVGLGCPKQERWMARYADDLQMMMIGIGAAFDFISGEVKTSPSWMHGACLEWLHRLICEPRRLWRRYLATSPRFLWLFLTRDRAMSSKSLFLVRLADWDSDQEDLRRIRERVFIQEQQVPVALEWDGLDEDAIHLLACDPCGNPIGCARVLDSGVIGRVAVLAQWRGQGVGSALLAEAIACCRNRGWPVVTLSAQTHAIPFYERMGFIVCSEEYMDAGIPHSDMRLELSI